MWTIVCEVGPDAYARENMTVADVSGCQAGWWGPIGWYSEPHNIWVVTWQSLRVQHGWQPNKEWESCVEIISGSYYISHSQIKTGDLSWQLKLAIWVESNRDSTWFVSYGFGEGKEMLELCISWFIKTLKNDNSWRKYVELCKTILFIVIVFLPENLMKSTDNI